MRKRSAYHAKPVITNPLTAMRPAPLAERERRRPASARRCTPSPPAAIRARRNGATSAT